MAKKYRYPNSKKVFVLKEIKGCIYYFKCGHWCTDNVFTDLIDLKTGLAQWQVSNQLEIDFDCQSL